MKEPYNAEQFEHDINQLVEQLTQLSQKTGSVLRFFRSRSIHDIHDSILLTLNTLGISPLEEKKPEMWKNISSYLKQLYDRNSVVKGYYSQWYMNPALPYLLTQCISKKDRHDFLTKLLLMAYKVGFMNNNVVFLAWLFPRFDGRSFVQDREESNRVLNDFFDAVWIEYPQQIYTTSMSEKKSKQKAGDVQAEEIGLFLVELQKASGSYNLSRLVQYSFSKVVDQKITLEQWVHTMIYFLPATDFITQKDKVKSMMKMGIEEGMDRIHGQSVLEVNLKYTRLMRVFGQAVSQLENYYAQKVTRGENDKGNKNNIFELLNLRENVIESLFGNTSKQCTWAFEQWYQQNDTIAEYLGTLSNRSDDDRQEMCDAVVLFSLMQAWTDIDAPLEKDPEMEREVQEVLIRCYQNERLPNLFDILDQYNVFNVYEDEEKNLVCKDEFFSRFLDPILEKIHRQSVPEKGDVDQGLFGSDAKSFVEKWLMHCAPDFSVAYVNGTKKVDKQKLNTDVVHKMIVNTLRKYDTMIGVLQARNDIDASITERFLLKDQGHFHEFCQIISHLDSGREFLLQKGCRSIDDYIKNTKLPVLEACGDMFSFCLESQNLPHQKIPVILKKDSWKKEGP